LYTMSLELQQATLLVRVGEPIAMRPLSRLVSVDHACKLSERIKTNAPAG
jgi:hypothetical protein